MNQLSQAILLEAFERSAEIRHRKEAEAAEEDHRWVVDRRHETAKREKEEQRQIAETAPAIPQQLAQFNEQLDQYDATVVEALMENRRALDKAEAHVAELRARAFTLPDGRKVFKSADGRSVYDEDGNQLSRNVVDPASISDSLPTRETWFASKGDVQGLESKQRPLLELQTEIDHSREVAPRPGTTQGELLRLKENLDRNMSESVRSGLIGPGPQGQSPAGFSTEAANNRAATLPSMMP